MIDTQEAARRLGWSVRTVRRRATNSAADESQAAGCSTDRRSWPPRPRGEQQQHDRDVRGRHTTASRRTRRRVGASEFKEILDALETLSLESERLESTPHAELTEAEYASLFRPTP